MHCYHELWIGCSVSSEHEGVLSESSCMWKIIVNFHKDVNIQRRTTITRHVDTHFAGTRRMLIICSVGCFTSLRPVNEKWPSDSINFRIPPLVRSGDPPPAKWLCLSMLLLFIVRWRRHRDREILRGGRGGFRRHSSSSWYWIGVGDKHKWYAMDGACGCSRQKNRRSCTVQTFPAKYFLLIFGGKQHHYLVPVGSSRT